jgi:hypothetical protein
MQHFKIIDQDFTYLDKSWPGVTVSRPGVYDSSLWIAPKTIEVTTYEIRDATSSASHAIIDENFSVLS